MKEKLKNKKVVYTIIGIVSVLLVALAATYAYWLVTKTQTGENEITAGCLDITISGEKNDIELTNQFPMSDEDGMKLIPYEFTVTNNCNTSVDYHVNLEAIEAGDEIGTDSIKAVLNESTPRKLYNYVGADTTIENAYEAYTLGYGTLAASGSEGSSTTYKLRVWIDEDAPISEMNKTFKSKISVTIGQGISAQGNALASLILEDAEENNYLYTTTPDFNTVNADGEYGLYSAEDDYGTSYYFRGDAENNYVKLGIWKETASEVKGCMAAGIEASCVGETFETMEACEASSNNYAWCNEMKYADEGNDMYWRIVRINGDGTIRLVYDGTSAVANGTKKTAIIGRTAYNTNYENAKYVGYTYDDGNGTQVDSTIKGVVDKWYANNLESEYGKYIADSIFCNDREVTSTSGTTQYYGAYTRLYTNKTPKLSCTQDADKYTVSNTRGNGFLTKPVGLMTADEIAMAGGKYGASNSNFYLYTGSTFDWSMTPSYFDGSYARVWYVYDAGYLMHYRVSSSEHGVRPVINLKADVLFEGDGSYDTPYVIK